MQCLIKARGPWRWCTNLFLERMLSRGNQSQVHIMNKNIPHKTEILIHNRNKREVLIVSSATLKQLYIPIIRGITIRYLTDE